MTRSRQGQQSSSLLAHALQAAFSNAEYGVTAMRGTAGRYSNWLEPSSHDDLRRLEEAARARSNQSTHEQGPLADPWAGDVETLGMA